MTVEVAILTPKPPVSLFLSRRLSLDTSYQDMIAPNLFAQVDERNDVQSLRSTTAVIAALRLTNTNASPRTVDFRVRSSRRVRYQAQVTAQAGENWLRLDRVRNTRGVSIFGYDWTDSPPTRLLDEPEQLAIISRSAQWTSDSVYLAVTTIGSRFRIYDATNDFSTAFTSTPTPSPVETVFAVWSPDDRYLAVTYRYAEDTGHPFLKVFDFDTFNSPVEVTIPDLATLVTTDTDMMAWGGPSGRYLILGGAGPNLITVFDWTTGSPVFATALSAALSAEVSGDIRDIAFSPDADYLAIGHTTGDRLTVFEWPTATTVSKIQNALFAANTQRLIGYKGLAWSADSRYLACLSSASENVPYTVYDFQGGVSLRSAPEDLPALPPLRNATWSPDGRYLCMGHSEATRFTYYPGALPYLLLFDYNSGDPVRITSSPRLQGFGGTWDVQFSPDGDFLMVAGQAFDRFYPPTGVDTVTLLDANDNNYVVNGSFEDTTGLTRETFGFSAISEIPGWFSDEQAEPPGVRIYLPNQRFVDAFATTGSIYLDLVADSLGFPAQNDVRLRQNFDNLVEGQSYFLSVDITASLDSDIGLRILWNGAAVDFSGITTLPAIEDFDLVTVTVPGNGSVNAPLEKHMLAYGDTLQVKASGGGVSANVSYVLSTQEEALRTITEPPPPPVEQETGT